MIELTNFKGVIYVTLYLCTSSNQEFGYNYATVYYINFV